MGKRGKKYVGASQGVDRTKAYDFKEALTLAVDGAYAKFDETIDIAVRLGVDPRHADQMVRGTVMLPNGTGKEVRVLVRPGGARLDGAAQRHGQGSTGFGLCQGRKRDGSPTGRGGFCR